MKKGSWCLGWDPGIWGAAEPSPTPYAVIGVICPPYQALNVPPALATHVTRELGKGLILILNKVDLTSPAVATAWSHLLRRRFPAARVVPFTSAPRRNPAPGRGPGEGGGLTWGGTPKCPKSFPSATHPPLFLPQGYNGGRNGGVVGAGLWDPGSFWRPARAS